MKRLADPLLLCLLLLTGGQIGPTIKRIDNAIVKQLTIDMNQPAEQLTGFAIVAPGSKDTPGSRGAPGSRGTPGWAIMTSAMTENNVTVIRWPIE